MEFVLTGDPASGAEFERLGVVTKVFPKADVLPAAVALAEKIAKLSAPVIKTAKQAVLTGMSQSYFICRQKLRIRHLLTCSSIRSGE